VINIQNPSRWGRDTSDYRSNFRYTEESDTQLINPPRVSKENNTARYSTQRKKQWPGETAAGVSGESVNEDFMNEHEPSFRYTESLIYQSNFRDGDSETPQMLASKYVSKRSEDKVKASQMTVTH
jgi:hypothetical protein